MVLVYCCCVWYTYTVQIQAIRKYITDLLSHPNIHCIGPYTKFVYKLWYLVVCLCLQFPPTAFLGRPGLWMLLTGLQPCCSGSTHPPQLSQDTTLCVESQSSEPSEEARNPQPWPAVFTFPCRGQEWLEQIIFVQSWSTNPVVVASVQLLNGSISIQLAQWKYFPVWTHSDLNNFQSIEKLLFSAEKVTLLTSWWWSWFNSFITMTH